MGSARMDGPTWTARSDDPGPAFAPPPAAPVDSPADECLHPWHFMLGGVNQPQACPRCGGVERAPGDLPPRLRQRGLNGAPPAAPVNAGQGTPEPRDAYEALPERLRRLLPEIVVGLLSVTNAREVDGEPWRTIGAISQEIHRAFAHPAPAPLGDGDARALLAAYLEARDRRKARTDSIARRGGDPTPWETDGLRRAENNALEAFAAALRGSRGPEPRVEAAISEAVAAFAPLVDNAGGYDKSNVRSLILQVETLGGSFGAWTPDELKAAEERARAAWRGLDALSTGTGGDDA